MNQFFEARAPTAPQHTLHLTKQMKVQVIDTVTDYELKDNSDKRQHRVFTPILETTHGHR